MNGSGPEADGCGWRRLAKRAACRVARGQVSAIASAVLALAVVALPCARAAPTEAHGSLDAFTSPGLAMAWGVLRGKDDASTEVVVRIDADPSRYRTVSVAGIDPFTKASQVIVAPTALGRTRLVRVPRRRFADLPRTEWRFYAGATAAAGDLPALVVDYQGVPDTTPEFDTEAKLEASLAERIARVRGAGKP